MPQPPVLPPPAEAPVPTRAGGEGHGFKHLGDREIARLHRIRVVTATFEAPEFSGATSEGGCHVVRRKR